MSGASGFALQEPDGSRTLPFPDPLPFFDSAGRTGLASGFDIEEDPKPMNCDDVTHDQARRVHEALAGPLLYLQRLERRLADLAFDPAERFSQLVVEAHNALHPAEHRDALHELQVRGVASPR